MSSISADLPASRSMTDRLLVPLLAIAGMLTMLNVVVLGPLMPEISRDLSVSVPALGQITAAVFFGSAIVGLFAGPLGDQFGRKRLVVYGLLIVTVSAIGSMLAPTFGWLFAVRLISAVSSGLMAGTTLAIAGTLFDGIQRRRAIGSIASGMAAAPIFGIPALTFIASISSWRASMAALGLAALGLALCARLVVPVDNVQNAGRIELGRIVGAYSPLTRDRGMIVLLSASLVRAIGWIGLLTYLGGYWDEQHGLTVREIGWMAMALGVGYFVGSKLGGGRLAGVNARMLFGTTTLACGVSFGGTYVIPATPIVSLSILMIAAVTGGIGYVALTALVSSESPAGQGTTMSLNAAMFALGSALGGAVGGALLVVGGYEALGAGLMGFVLISAVLVWHPARQRFPAYRGSASGT